MNLFLFCTVSSINRLYICRKKCKRSTCNNTSVFPVSFHAFLCDGTVQGLAANLCFLIGRELTFEPISVETTASAKSFDSCQPAQSAQADMSRNFSPSLNFLRVNGWFYILNQSVVSQQGLKPLPHNHDF